MLALLLLLLLLPIVAFWNFFWKRRGLPPGPTPIPFFGNTLELNRSASAYEPFRKWTREYGPIYTVWMGWNPMVMVTEYGLMRDLFVKEGDVYAGRHFLAELFEKFKASNGKNGGVIRTEGETWRVMRRFGLQSLRNLGMGRAGLERQFLLDISKLIGKLRDEAAEGSDGKEMHLQKHIDRLIGSTINRVLFGYAFEDEQLGEFYELKRIMEWQTQLLMSVTGKMLMASAWLRHLPIFAQTFHDLDKAAAMIFKFVDRPIRARMAAREKQNAEERGEPKDLLDHFLDQMEAGEQGDEQMKEFNMDNLRSLCFDLFLAGQETTATTLSFLVCYLLLDQRAQEKMHEELDKLEAEKGGDGMNDGFGDGEGGGEGRIGLADRHKLPYLNAVINESQRLCNLLPINLSHRTTADVSILDGKFHLKKGTIIVPQISCVLFNEKIFPNPHRFEPERFLDEQGQLKKADEFIPFGLGKRICMGESIARMELFLFTANFFRHFQVLPVDPLKPPSAEKKIGFAVHLKPYNCRLVVRKKGRWAMMMND